MEGSRLTRDGTAESVSCDQILRRKRGHREKICFPVQLIRGVPSVEFPTTGVMESLWSGQGIYGRGGAVLGVGG